jgi:hypothetical protein
LVDPADGEKLDSAKASGVSNPFSSPSFTDVLVDSQPESLGLAKPVLIHVQTFDGFTYDVSVGQKTNNSYALTLKVAADLPRERTPGKDEKPEDKEKLDKEFKEKQKTLQEKLDREKALESRVFLVDSWAVDSLLKERSNLLVDAKNDSKAPGQTEMQEEDSSSTEEPPAPDTETEAP